MRRGEGKEEGRVRKGGGKREEMGFFLFFFSFSLRSGGERG